jgi:predicted HAD superfamily hydrolase
MSDLAQKLNSLLISVRREFLNVVGNLDFILNRTAENFGYPTSQRKIIIRQRWD